MNNRSKLVRMKIRNIGCIGDGGIDIELDNIVCLVGKNNSGKSTILRSYELAKGSQSFCLTDRCQSAPQGIPSEIELEVHIPEGIGNVDAKWKTAKDGLLIVKSRWQWASPDFKKTRTTWDPQENNGLGDWAEDTKAGGADPVFSSRLPRPLRIGSLDDAEKTESMLLTLALTPLLATIERERSRVDSELAKSISSVISQIEGLSLSHEEYFNKIAQQITTGFKGVFPKLGVHLNIGTAPWVPKIDALVKEGSGLLIKDGKVETSLHQQGTGARRALFWAMLQVHNEVSRDKELRDEHRKNLVKSISDDDKKKQKTKNAEEADAIGQKILEQQALLAAHDDGAAIPDSPEDPSLPGYLLLIDEPENALHPMASRAAQRHLYKLAESADWQVMMTTHSPYFINPLEDHTTIIRLERSGDDDTFIEPKTYRSDSIEFDGDEKKRLQALQHIDPSLAEIFFGSYPILVEGDTEHAAFIASIVEKQHEFLEKVTVIRARGKAILVSLIAVMKHFKIDFGIVHDCDPPYKKNGDHNGMWSENKKIRDAINAARSEGVTVRHRVSVPDFERYLGGDEESKDKPLNAYRAITEDDELSSKVQALINELVKSDQHEPFPVDVLKVGADYLDVLNSAVNEWAMKEGLNETIRFKGKVV